MKNISGTITRKEIHQKLQGFWGKFYSQRVWNDGVTFSGIFS